MTISKASTSITNNSTVPKVNKKKTTSKRGSNTGEATKSKKTTKKTDPKDLAKEVGFGRNYNLIPETAIRISDNSFTVLANLPGGKDNQKVTDQHSSSGNDTSKKISESTVITVTHDKDGTPIRITNCKSNTNKAYTNIDPNFKEKLQAIINTSIPTLEERFKKDLLPETTVKSLRQVENQLILRLVSEHPAITCDNRGDSDYSIGLIYSDEDKLVGVDLCYLRELYHIKLTSNDLPEALQRTIQDKFKEVALEEVKKFLQGDLNFTFATDASGGIFTVTNRFSQVNEENTISLKPEADGKVLNLNYGSNLELKIPAEQLLTSSNREKIKAAIRTDRMNQLKKLLVSDRNSVVIKFDDPTQTYTATFPYYGDKTIKDISKKELDSLLTTS